MNLFEDEQVLTTTADNVVTLTTHRIRSTNSYGWGQHSTTSIMLEKVSSIQAIFVSYPVLLIISGLLGVVAFLIGYNGSNREAMPILFVLALILVVVYFSTRKHICIISSDGGAKVIFATDNMKQESLTKFIDKVERAKQVKVGKETAH